VKCVLDRRWERGDIHRERKGKETAGDYITRERRRRFRGGGACLPRGNVGKGENQHVFRFKVQERRRKTRVFSFTKRGKRLYSRERRCALTNGQPVKCHPPRKREGREKKGGRDGCSQTRTLQGYLGVLCRLDDEGGGGIVRQKKKGKLPFL